MTSLSLQPTVTITFAKNGFVVSTCDDDLISHEVYGSSPKLIKALKTLIDEYSLLPVSTKTKSKTEKVDEAE